jgi:hypothetical protein
VYRPYATQPELIQVVVSPAPAPSGRDSLAGEESARDTGPALPIARTIAFDPPPQGRPPAPLALEDYVLGLSHEARVREPYEALLPLWLARLSREGA